ncbi:DNA primase [Streptomyces nigrescens]|uniref:DNA primase n=1 Tax=Streptomyces nigrescens TaxID=1920 RepID=UPI003823BE40
MGSKKLPAGEVNVEFASRRVETVAVGRLTAVDSPELPAALTRRARWVRRSSSKCPLTSAGSPASASDDSTWTTYADAAASTAGAGLGFVLNGDGVVCVDIDHCITDGVLSTEAEAFIASLPETYIEISPSGDGLHIWGRGMVLTSRKFRNAGMQGEVIGSRKYATVTGKRFRDAPLTLANIAAQAGPLIY